MEREGVFPDSGHAERFAPEIDESVANLALAYLAKETFATQFADVQGSVFDVLRNRDIPAADHLTFLERLVTDGHPFHPGAKIRRGMTPSDSLTYAPEFTERIDLRFMALRRDVALDSTLSNATLTDRLFQVFPGLRTAVTGSLPSRTSLSEYAVVPVHPWQYTHVLSNRVSSLVASRTLVPIQDYSVPASPLLSLRTVVPYTNYTSVEAPPHLKLPIDVRLTNTIRTLAPESVYNGPHLSRILCDIEATGALERFGIFRKKLQPVTTRRLHSNQTKTSLKPQPMCRHSYDAIRMRIHS